MAKVGRPKITTEKFPDGWQEHIINEMSQGASRAEIYAWLNIDKEVFTRLIEEDQEFSETIKSGERQSHAWWERKGRTELDNKDFSATLWYMNMKNRFGWRDKQETDITSGGQPIGVTVSDDQLTQLTQARARRSDS